jgi:hypothetical protein
MIATASRTTQDCAARTSSHLAPRALPGGREAWLLLISVAVSVGFWIVGDGGRDSYAIATASADAPFVVQGAGRTTATAQLTDQPMDGAVLGLVEPGTDVEVGGSVRVGRRWIARTMYWVRVGQGTEVRKGFLPASAVTLVSGTAPELVRDGVGLVASSGVADQSLAAPAGRVGIAWLPETVRRWEPLILQAASKHGVDPELVAIVTLVESGGNPNAVSSSGARGLMQVMPSTGADISRQRGMSGYDPAWLADPATNIDFGTWYLAQMLRSFGHADDPDWQQSVALAAAAYNGGPGRVQSHLAGANLPAETARYQTWVSQMWSERSQASSSGFQSWMDAGGRLLVAQARGVASLP